MGKLHSLKKAIKSNPRKWYWTSYSKINYAWGAHFMDNGWHTTDMPSYKKFVAKTLSELTEQEVRS